MSLSLLWFSKKNIVMQHWNRASYSVISKTRGKLCSKLNQVDLYFRVQKLLKGCSKTMPHSKNIQVNKIKHAREEVLTYRRSIRSFQTLRQVRYNLKTEYYSVTATGSQSFNKPFALVC